MAKAEVIEIAIFPSVASAMISEFTIIRPTGGVPLVETPVQHIRL